MEENSNELKWFGEGFEGFPKRLPDDCVEYMLFVLDIHANETEIRERLRNLQTFASGLTKKLTKGFIWQRESFELKLVKEDGKVSDHQIFLLISS